MPAVSSRMAVAAGFRLCLFPVRGGGGMDSVLYEQFFRLEDRHWWFLGRRGRVLRELRPCASKSPGPLLDLGGGTGGMRAPLQRLGPAVGLNSPPEGPEPCRKRGVPFVMGSGSTLPFRDGA